MRQKIHLQKGNKYGNWELIGQCSEYFYKRFENEVKVMCKIKNLEGVLPIIDYYLPHKRDKANPAWYVMPIALPLKEYTQDKDEEEIVDLFIKLAKCLATLHEQGISHRDIKPENLFYYHGTPCFGDFGLADFPDKEALTKPGKLGPAWTIAPEMRRNPDKADGKLADSYSFAKTFWMFLTKQWSGFDGQYNPDDSSISLKKYCKTIFCEPLEELLVRCTNNIPEERPQMEEIASKLQEWKALNKDHVRKNRKKWKIIQENIFPKGQPERAIWTNLEDIINILNLLTETNLNHTFLPRGGGLDLIEVKKSIEKDCVELNLEEFVHIVKPKQLIFESFRNNPEWNYFRLETHELESVSGNPKFKEGGEELLTEIKPGLYTDYECWEFNDFNGESLPNTARPIIRILCGNFVIFCKTSPYNKIPQTYDGRHDKLNAIEFRRHVEELIKAHTKANQLVTTNKDTSRDKEIKFIKSCKIKQGRKLTSEELELLNQVLNLAEEQEKEEKTLREKFNIDYIVTSFPSLSKESFKFLFASRPAKEKLRCFLESLDNKQIVLIASVMYAGKDYLQFKRSQPIEDMIHHFINFDKNGLVETIMGKSALVRYLKAGIEVYS